jgi:hypothetical protein
VNETRPPRVDSLEYVIINMVKYFVIWEYVIDTPRSKIVISLIISYERYAWYMHKLYSGNVLIIQQDGMALSIDLSPFEWNFDLDKSGQKFHNSLKEHHKISNIPKFRCEML